MKIVDFFKNFFIAKLNIQLIIIMKIYDFRHISDLKFLLILTYFQRNRHFWSFWVIPVSPPIIESHQKWTCIMKRDEKLNKTVHTKNFFFTSNTFRFSNHQKHRLVDHDRGVPWTKVYTGLKRREILSNIDSGCIWLLALFPGQKGGASYSGSP